MMNEFKDLDLLCSGSSIVPSGSGYSTSVGMNQVCTLAGAKPGQQYVRGADYIQAGESLSTQTIVRSRKGQLAYGLN